MNVAFATPLGFAQANPVGGLVASALDAGRLDEGLEQHRPVAVTLLPVCGQSSRADRQHTRGQIATAYPWQNQKSRVVHNQVQPGLALLGTLADEAVTGL